MAIVTKGTDGTFTEVADPSLFTNILDGLKAPMLSENEYLDSSSSFWAAVAYGSLGSVGGSMLARKRAREGKEAIGGILF